MHGTVPKIRGGVLLRITVYPVSAFRVLSAAWYGLMPSSPFIILPAFVELVATVACSVLSAGIFDIVFAIVPGFETFALIHQFPSYPVADFQVVHAPVAPISRRLP